MLVDALALPDKSEVEADICIVGAGPAGITLARELNRQHIQVCLVESGGTDFDSESQALSRLGAADSDITPAYQYRRRQFGGNAHFWRVGRRPFRSLVRYLPLEDIDFASRPWVPHAGWPFGKRELAPFYERAHRILGLGEYSYSVPDEEIAGARPLALDEDVRTSVEWFGTADPFLNGALAELRQSANVTVLVHANVAHLQERPKGDRIDRVRIDCLNGANHFVSASAFVLAAGGIENARLLLLSKERTAAGIGNTYDLVGRFFMDHLHVRGVLVPSDRNQFEATALYDVRRIADGRIMGCKLNLSPDLMQREKILNSALKLEARMPSRPLLRFVDTYVRLALKHRQLRPSQFGWSTLPDTSLRFADFATHLQIELPPNPQNRVVLAPERDLFGRPLAAVQWKWDPLSRRSAQRTRQILSDAFARAALGRLLMPGDDPPSLPHTEGINHHIGTTRMHVDPRQGVVDADCRVHGVENLFVAGSSVFPTGGYANPTLTIVALAIRLADHLRARLRIPP